MPLNFSLEISPWLLDNVVCVANDNAFADATKKLILINALNGILPKQIAIPISAI